MAEHRYSEDQWRHIYQLAEAVVEVPIEQRSGYLESKCSDPAIRSEVWELVAHLESEDGGSEDRVGSYVGRFEIREYLGSGGAGEVFSAFDPELRRQVAIKILRAEQSALPEANERFIREARTASTLNHPNIVTVYEIIRGEKNLAIAMELVEGKSLRSICGEPMEISRLVPICQQAAEALAAAHAAGVVHRDIKPENLMLMNVGRVKVLDFGLARLNTAAQQSLNAGIPAGTLRYMSPEHYRGETLTNKTDIFALGLVIYELATGALPFGKKSSLDALHAIAMEEVKAPSSANAKIDAGLDRLILAMLDKDPVKRPDAEEVARILRTWKEASASHEAPVVAARAKWKWWAVAAVAVAIVAAVAWSLYLISEKTRRLEQITHSIPENRLMAAAISGDGKYLAYSNSDGIFQQLLDGGETSTLKSPKGFIVDNLSWSPDGTRLLASGFAEETSRAAIWSISVRGAAPELLREDARLGAMSPDGKSIAFLGSDYSSIWTMDSDGQSEKRIVDARAEDTFSTLCWASNSNYLIVSRRHTPQRGGAGEADKGNMVMESADSINAISGALAGRKERISVWSAAGLSDGVILFLSGSKLKGEGFAALWSVRMNLSTGVFESDVQRIPLPESFEEQYASALTASNDGAKWAMLRRASHSPVFVADFHREAVRFSNFRRLTLDDGGNYPHTWTADSQFVIYESDRAKPSYDLFKQHVSRRVPEAIVSTPRRSEALAQLAPDQKSVLFASTPVESRDYSLMRVGVDGGVPKAVPIGGPLDEFRCSPHPKGRCVLRKTNGIREYIYYDLDPVKGIGAELARVAWWPSFFGDWDVSPDGRFVAIPNHDTRSAKVRLIRIDPAGPEELDREVKIPSLTRLSVLTWAADGTGWFLSIDTSIGRRMYFYDLKGHLTSLGTIQGWAVPAPDGKKVAFLNDIVQSNAWILSRGQ